MVLAQGPREDGLVVRDPVAQRAQRVQRLVGLPARQGRAVGKRAAERRPPERLLVVGLGAGPFDAASGAEQRDPEAERERRDHPGRRRVMAGALRGHPRVGNPLASPPVESGRRVVVPLLAVAGGELAVHGVAQHDLERLERPVERGGDGRVPRVEPQRLRPVFLGGLQVGADAFRRERRLETVEEVPIGGGCLDSSPRSRYGHEVRPGSASAFGYAPGVLLFLAAAFRPVFLLSCAVGARDAAEQAPD